jgi:hypothetical protein
MLAFFIWLKWLFQKDYSSAQPLQGDSTAVMGFAGDWLSVCSGQGPQDVVVSAFSSLPYGAKKLSAEISPHKVLEMFQCLQL